MKQYLLAIAILLACLIASSPALARHHHRTIVTDANGNGVGRVTSHKTGATAHVGAAYAGIFQSYIDDLESRGASIRFMGGIRPGRCWSGSLHPCGKALDVCQLGRGRVDGRCHLPSRHELARIASAHGLFEGGRWCSSDYGHAQVGETAASCGSWPRTLMASAQKKNPAPDGAGF